MYPTSLESLLLCCVLVSSSLQVFNLTTYEHLMGLFEALGVDTEESEMSFALSIDRGAFEWASHSLATVFAQRENMWKLSFWRMLWDVLRFGQRAPEVAHLGLFIA